MARDVRNDVAVLKVDANVKGVRPLDLHLDAFEKQNPELFFSVNSNEIRLERTGYLIGFPNGATRRVMTKVLQIRFICSITLVTAQLL